MAGQESPKETSAAVRTLNRSGNEKRESASVRATERRSVVPVYYTRR